LVTDGLKAVGINPDDIRDHIKHYIHADYVPQTEAGRMWQAAVTRGLQAGVATKNPWWAAGGAAAGAGLQYLQDNPDTLNKLGGYLSSRGNRNSP
jgi:hypothetical protein